jgi:plasmid stabilization system protein ParE
VTSAFVYGGAAQAELRDIFGYTAQQRGADQARAYARQIDKAAAELATGQGIYKDWGAVLTGLRVKAVGSHLVFCVVRPGKPAVALANLHQRMVLMTRLKGQLA